MLGVLTKQECRNILSSQVLGRIACCDENLPYIVPLTYSYDGEFLYGQTFDGKKLEILRKHPRVCFEVDTMTDMRNWKSVLVFGEFEELSDREAEQARSKLFDKVLTLMTSATVHPHEHETTGTVADDRRMKPIMYRIRIEEITGRFERDSGN